jgi:hypothetical protein
MLLINAARATPAATGRDPPEDRLGGSIKTNNQFFLEKASFHDREWWRSEAVRLGSDWQSVGELAIEIISSLKESDRERSNRVAEVTRQRAHKQAPRRTPQSTIDAVMDCVRERGLVALREPTNRARLRTFDAEARRQLNNRIARLEQEAPHA